MGIDWEGVFGDDVDLNDAWEDAVARATLEEERYKSLHPELTDSPAPDERMEFGSINGQHVSIKNHWGNYFFTRNEIKSLFNGEEIEFDYTNKNGQNRHAKGKLMQNFYNGKELKWVFTTSYSYDYVSGIFHGEMIEFSRTWSNHAFTNDEIIALFSGEEIEIGYVDKSGTARQTKGKLAKREYKGKSAWRFVPDFDLTDKKD